MTKEGYNCYWYAIQDNITGQYYVGSQFGKNADPKTFWQPGGYFTSCTQVQELVEEFGPERFTVVRCQSRPDAYEYETRFLQRVNARMNPAFYNGHNNDGFACKPDTTVVKDKDGNCFRVSLEEFRRRDDLSGVAKGNTFKHKDNSNYFKPKANKENYRGLMTVRCKGDSKWIRIRSQDYDRDKHITPTSKPKTEAHKQKIGLGNRKPRPKISCLLCRLEVGINNLAQHQKGRNCDKGRL